MKSDKPIVFVINRLAVGGAERLLVSDINELLKRGEFVYLITLRKEADSSLSSSCDISQNWWKVIPFDGFFDIRAWFRFVRLMYIVKPRVLISHLWFANAITRVGGVLGGVRCRITFEQNVYDQIKSKKQLLLDKILQILSTKIIAVSGAVKDSLIRNGIRPEKIFVLHNAISVDVFSNHTDGEKIKKELGFDSSEFLFLTVGRLTKQKAHDILLRAFAPVSGELVVVGEGEEKRQLESLASNLGISNRVHFLGVRNDVLSIMQAVDCFLFPSRWEGTSIVLLEALSVGLPIITTEFSGVQEVITHEENGVIVPIDDPQELSRAMQKIQENRGLREYISSNAKNTANHFSISKHVDTLLSIVK